MLYATYVRPDRITRTSVLEPTAEGYQPVRSAQGVAQQFTQIYGPTIWGNGYGLGQEAASCPVCPPCANGGPAAPRPGAVMTSKGPMTSVGVKTADTNEEAVAAMAKTFARGQSVRITDKQGRVVVAHPNGRGEKFPFWSQLINKARDVAQKMMVRRGRTGPLWQKPTTPQLPTEFAYRPAPPRPGAVPVAYGWAPAFNRPAQAANTILPSGGRPPQSVYLPERAGAQQEVPGQLTASSLSRQIQLNVPGMVSARGRANALDWFHRTGRYY